MQTKDLRLKRVLCAALLVLLLSVVGMTKTYAYDFSAVCPTGQTLYYNIIDEENHYVELTYPATYNTSGWYGFTKPTGNIVLPESVQYDGVTYTLTRIGYYAFYHCSDLTGSLTIPNSVTYIDNSAFEYCSGFTGSLTIPNFVTSIRQRAFYNCSGFTGSLIIPNSVTFIGESAFYNCRGFTGSLTIPNSVTSIGASAFYNCYGFTGSLTIGNSVIEISPNAFAGCYGFNGSLTIPDSVTIIGNSAFAGCYGFNEVRYLGDMAGWCNISFASWDSNPLSNSLNLYINNSLVTNLIIPETVTEIKNFSFVYCSSLSSITIHNAVTKIGNGAFYGCSGLTGSLIIPNSVTYIGGSAFCECTGFTGSLTIPNSVTTIGNNAFQYCYGFTGSLTIPNSVTYIGSSAFYGCSGFTGNLTIPNSVTSIREKTFYNCSGFTGSLTIPNSVTSIGYSAFYGCSGFTGGLTIGNSVTSIGEEAFLYCSGFTGSLTIGNSVIWIGERAFESCRGFTGSLTIPNSVTTIGNKAFKYCSGLTGSLTIGNSVSIIGNNAFEYCSGFTGSLTIPNSVDGIADYAFSGCRGFTGSLTIPNSVTSIGDHAFDCCDGFTGSLTIPNSVIYIGNYAFNWCDGFTGSLTIPNSVTSIGDRAFFKCGGLTNLTIGYSVATIGTSAFYSCSGLTEIHVCRTAPASLASYAFYGTSCPIYVPYESLNTYRTASGWSSYANRISSMAFITVPGHGILSLMPYKTIQDYEDDTINWVFISSPLAGNTAPTAVGNIITATDYDLYQFNQSVIDAEWRNYKANNFNLVNGQGYLYANTEEVNVIFKGNFNENGTKEVSIAYDANAECAGWNLVGNPFPVNAYLLDENNEAKPFYKMNDTGDAIVAAQPGTAIKPCEGVFVICPNDGEAHSVIFTTTAPASLGEAQNGPLVSLPMHDLLMNQDAFFIITQTTALSEGWNWFSTYIEADDLLQQLEVSLGENGLYIESSELLSTEYLDGEWLGDLDEVGITNEQMYLIQTSADCTIQLQGTVANPANHVITIHPEWNWVGYPCSEEMTIAEALANFVPEDGDRIESMEGYAEYLDGEWLGLETLKPGQGFMYYSNSTTPKTFTFPASAK